MVAKIHTVAADPWDDLATQAPQHFEDLHTGKPKLPPTPLYRNEGLTPKQILDAWVKELAPYETKYPETVKYDLSRTKKYGPRGGYPPWSVMKEELPKYSERLKRIDFDDPRIKQAIAETQKFLGLDKCLNRRPLDLRTAAHRIIEDMEATYKRSGVASYGNKRDPEVIKRAMQHALNPDATLEDPFVLAERTQRINLEKTTGGTRFIFEISYALEMVQKRFFYPLFDYIRSLKKSEYAAWESFEDVEEFPLRKKDGKEVFISIDFTGMDQSSGPDQTELFYLCTRNFFQRNFWDLYHKVLFAGVTAPIMVEYLRAWDPGSHGTASGESFTNLKETVDNTCGHYLAMILQGQPHQHQDDGDDSIAVGSDQLVDYLSKAFAMLGFEVNPEKQDTSLTSYHYLQRFFCPAELGTDGAYPTILALNACVYPERMHSPAKWGPRMETLRWIMILENCKHHPAFHALIEFVKKGDKYGLSLGPDPEAVYAAGKALNGFVPSYNQASKDRGICDFEVMKYL